LISNAQNNYNSIYEGRVYQLKHTNFEDKQWVCQGVKRRFRSAMHTNSNVNAVLKFAPHAHNCTPYNNILHKIEKYNLKRGAAEEKKLILHYTSSISANLKTISRFSIYRQVNALTSRSQAKRFPLLSATKNSCSQPKGSYLNILSGVFDSCFKITPEWYQQMFTIHVFLECKINFACIMLYCWKRCWNTIL
ncbi:hypothetical protein T08_7800, partial [Trichinella sp. T8]